MAASVPIDPRRLIDHARELAHHQGGAGRPRPVWLRRAASASYYALFHAIALRVGQQVLPSGSRDDQQRLSRSVAHGALREVCQWVTGKPGAGKQHVQPIVTMLQQSPRLVLVARVALRLQEERHRADYDHLAPFGKAAVLSLVNEAALGLDELDALTGTEELEQLIALVALHSKLA